MSLMYKSHLQPAFLYLCRCTTLASLLGVTVAFVVCVIEESQPSMALKILAILCTFILAVRRAAFFAKYVKRPNSFGPLQAFPPLGWLLLIMSLIVRPGHFVISLILTFLGVYVITIHLAMSRLPLKPSSFAEWLKQTRSELETQASKDIR